MGGKGGGAAIPKEVEEAAGKLKGVGEEQYDIGLPIIQEGAKQAEDVLAGGFGNLRPSILRALETGRSQGSDVLTRTREDAALSGLTGTALQTQLARTRESVENDVAGIPSSFTYPVLESAATQAYQAPQQGLQNISSALSSGASSAFVNPSHGGALGGLSGAASGAATGMMVAGPYGALAGAVLGGAKGAK